MIEKIKTILIAHSAGSFGILLYALIAIACFYFLPFGASLFICGFFGFFAMGAFLFFFSKPVSPITAILCVPCLFVGWMGSDFLAMSQATTIQHVKPSQLQHHPNDLLFQFKDFLIKQEFTTSISTYIRQSSKRSHFKVVPLVDSDWHEKIPIKSFAICKGETCQKGWEIPKNQGIRRDSSNEQMGEFRQAAKQCAQNFKLIVDEDPTFIELTKDIIALKNEKKQTAFMAFYFILIAWNITALFSTLPAKKNSKAAW